MPENDSVSVRIEALAAQLDGWGCTPEEIDEVRRAQGVDLPRSYETFLRVLGRDGGGLVGGTEVCFGEIAQVRRWAIDLLEENRAQHPDEEVFRLPDDAVVISSHQGYVFEFVRTSLGDDPPVEWWSEGSTSLGRSTVGAASIADWLERELVARDRRSEEALRSHRRSIQAMRRRRFQPEMCPTCGGNLQWRGEIVYQAGDPNSGRDRQIAMCAAEGRSFWRWGDEPDTPLR